MDASEATPPEASPPGSGASPALARPAPRAKPPYATIGVILAVALIVIGLGISGVIPGFHLTVGPANKPAPGPPPPYLESVTFHETGLPASTDWSLTIGATTTASRTTEVEFQLPNGSYSFTVGVVAGFAASPASGTVRVQGPTSVPIAFGPGGALAPHFNVTFTESGLPASTNWAVELNGTTMAASSASIQFSEPNGTYAYDVLAIVGYGASPSSGTLTVSGPASPVAIAFQAAPPASYPVAFQETGLASGAAWSVMVGGRTLHGTGPSLTTTEPNGSYLYTVPALSADTASPSSGMLTVNGKAVQLAITFTPVSPPSPGNYTLTINETGLPFGTTWQALLVAGSPPFASTPPEFGAIAQGSSIELTAPNGSYVWQVSPTILGSGAVTYYGSPSNGTLTIAGADQRVTVAYSAPVPTSTNYSVTVRETGLPSGTAWYAYTGTNFQVGIAGQSISFSLPNGTYPFGFAAAAPSYYPHDHLGTLVEVDGTARSVAEPFYYGFAVNFSASGLAAGAKWSVTVNGTALDGTGDSYSTPADLANGTYAYAIVPVVGYRGPPGTGSFTVLGRALSVPLTFHALASYSVSFTEKGLPAGDTWAVAIDVDGDFNSTVSVSNNAPSISVSLPDGNFSWEVSSGSGHFASPMSGGLTVRGPGTQVNVTYQNQPSEGIIEFVEADAAYNGVDGLPNGTSWSVTLNGTTESTTGMLLDFLEPNGTYQFMVHAPAGYAAVPESGIVTAENIPFQGAGVHVAFYSGHLPAPVPLVRHGPPAARLPIGLEPPDLARFEGTCSS
jgi:hypothetical protein